MSRAPQGSVALASAACDGVSIVIRSSDPEASVPLIITLGNAKYRAAPATSPRRSASDHPLITLTASTAAGMPVGPGVGSGAFGFTSGAGVAGEVMIVRGAARVVVCTIEVPAPHPTAINPTVVTAKNQAG